MKKVLLFIILTAVVTFSAFSRGTYPIETVEICIAYGTEDYLKNKLPSEYKIVKTHPSEKGSVSINQEFVRDIQISKTLNGVEKNVGYIYPYYENKKTENLKGKINRDSYIDYYKIKDKITLIALPI